MRLGLSIASGLPAVLLRLPSLSALLFLAPWLTLPALGQTNVALHRPSTQSSTILPPNGASVCVDGNRTSGWCHTNRELNPWWQVDLEGNYALSQIVVYNRADEYGAREATIGALVSSDGQNWTRIYSHDGSNVPVIRINGGNRTARYVRLQLAATDYLNLLEVEVYGAGSAQPAPQSQSSIGSSTIGQTNVALHKPSTQSSTILPPNGANVCVDGNRASGWCHTNRELNPWWQVDLERSYALSQIVVYNRADEYGAREATIGALVSSDGQNWTQIYSHDGSNVPVIRINGGNRTARYVRLQLAATDYLNLLEVEVYGTGSAQAAPQSLSSIGSSTIGQTNVALHKPSTQSSTILPPNGASVCVDGNRTSGWCHTNSEPNPWWQVDLEVSYALSQIVVYNRADEYGAREATIGALVSSDGQNWTRIYSHDGSNVPVIRINGGNRTARYVRLQLAATDYLNLLEVEVYGTGSAQAAPQSLSSIGSSTIGQTNTEFRKPSTPSSGAAPARAAAKQEVAIVADPAASDTIPAPVSSTAVPYQAEETQSLDALVQSFDSADASLVMEGLRVLGGATNPKIEQQLSKTLAGYFISPSVATREDLAKFRPMLMEMLAVQGAVATSAAAFDSAWEEAVAAASIDSEEGTRVALSLAAQHKAELQSQQARLVKIAQQAKSLPAQRDPVRERKKLQIQHQSAIKTVLQLNGGAKPVTASAAASGGSWGYKLIKSQMPPPQDPALGAYDPTIDARKGTYAVNDNETTWEYNHDVQGSAQRNTLRWRIPRAIIPEQPTEFWISGNAAGKWAQTLGGIQVNYGSLSAWVAGVRTNVEADDSTGPNNLEDRYSLTFPDCNALVAGIKQGKKPSYIMKVREWEKLAGIIESGNGVEVYKSTPSTIPERQWTAISEHTELYDYVPRQIRVEVWCPGRKTQLAVYTYEWSNGVDSGDHDLATEAADPTDNEKSQRVLEIEANIKIIQLNLERDEQELAKVTDSSLRAALQFRILHARADILAEQDLKASIQTGQQVHTRSPFDDYAHDLFVGSIRENQLKMESFQRASAALQRLAQLLPKGEDDIARNFVERQLTPDDRAHLNMAKVKEIANALSLKVEGFSKLEQAKNEEEAAMADYKLTVASNIKKEADTALMTVGIFMGGFAVKGAYSLNVLYQAGTGYGEGGLQTSIIKGVGAASYPAFLATTAFEGYRSDGWTGAGKSLALTYISGKAMQYGLGKALSAIPGKPAPPISEYIAQAQFKQARDRGIALVKDFERTNAEAFRLSIAARRGDPAAVKQLAEMEATLQGKAAAIHEDMQAKSFLKYKGDFFTQRGFNKAIGEIHGKTQEQWHKIMQDERKWDPTPLREFRNASSSGSVGMDHDIGLDQSAIQSLARNGRPATIREWQKDAQAVWNQAYKLTTGRSAARSWETVTTNLHPEAYKDLAWLSADKSGISKLWAQQAADVTRYKAWHVANDPNLSAMEKLMEISRGASKDITTKMLPLVQNARPGSAASAEALTEAQRHWNRINSVLDAFGKGQIDPVYATRRIRELTGGKSIHEVVTDATTLMESTAKLATPRK